MSFSSGERKSRSIIFKLAAISVLALMAVFSLTVPRLGTSVLIHSTGYSGSSYVPTPFGEAPSSCVYDVGNASTVYSNGTIVYANGTRKTPPPCGSAPISVGLGANPDTQAIHPPFPTNNWVEDANWCYCPTVPPAISLSDGYWNVPPAPGRNDGQVIYLFNGMQPSSSSGPIIQPVLQWGNNGYYGGAYWEAVSWFYSSTSNYMYSTPIRVSSGDQIYGLMAGSSCNSSTGACNWRILTEDTNIPKSTYIDVGSYAMYWAINTLEVYSVQSCADYPAQEFNPTVFSKLDLYSTTGSTLTPSWQSDVIQNDGCYENVVVNSASQASLYYGYTQYIQGVPSFGSTGTGSVSNPTYIVGGPDGKLANLHARNSPDTAYVEGDFGNIYSGTLSIDGYSYNNNVNAYYSTVQVQVSSDGSHWSTIYEQTWNPSSNNQPSWITIGGVSGIRYVLITAIDSGYSANVYIDSIRIA